MCWYIFQNISIETCSDLNCGNHGNCIKHENILVCKCKSGFTGQVCETAIGECESSPCKNNGVCKERPDRYECLCQAGYTGTLCEVGKCINEICLGIILIIFDTPLDLQHLGYFVFQTNITIKTCKVKLLDFILYQTCTMQSMVMLEYSLLIIVNFNNSEFL